MPSQTNKNVLYAVLALIGIACCVSLVWFLSQEPPREPESQAAGQPALGSFTTTREARNAGFERSQFSECLY